MDTLCSYIDFCFITQSFTKGHSTIDERNPAPEMYKNPMGFIGQTTISIPYQPVNSTHFLNESTSQSCVVPGE